MRNREEESKIELKKALLAEQKRLARICEETKESLENAPEGHLRVGKSQGCVQYYQCTETSPHNGFYINKGKSDLAKALAQKSYNEKIVKYADKVSAQLERLLKTYDDDKIEKIFLSEHPERQKLITPVEPTYQQLLEDWISIPFKGKPFNVGMPMIFTNGGVRVRSKSEKIMGDYFESVGLKYKYEYPIWLEPYGMVYPDFSFLSRKIRKIVYWEHEGMMDNADYARAAVQKIELYEKNGIFPGENLILTFETSTSGINMELVKMQVQKYLL